MIFETRGDKKNPAILMLNGSFSTGEGLIHIAEMISDEFYVILPIYDGHHKDSAIFTTRDDQASKIIAYLKNVSILLNKRIECIKYTDTIINMIDNILL